MSENSLHPISETNSGRQRAVVEGLSPEIDGGRFPAKRIVGDVITIEADVFTDGHDALSAVMLWRKQGASTWTEVPMTALANDRWRAEFVADVPGRYEFTVIGWVDHFVTWRHDMRKRIDAAQDTNVDYLIGAELVEQASTRAPAANAAWLRETARLLRSGNEAAEVRRTTALDEMLAAMMAR